MNLLNCSARGFEEQTLDILRLTNGNLCRSTAMITQLENRVQSVYSHIEELQGRARPSEKPVASAAAEEMPPTIEACFAEILKLRREIAEQYLALQHIYGQFEISDTVGGEERSNYLSQAALSPSYLSVATPAAPTGVDTNSSVVRRSLRRTATRRASHRS